MRGVQAGIDRYTWDTLLVLLIVGWMVRYGHDVFATATLTTYWRGGHAATHKQQSRTDSCPSNARLAYRKF